MSSSNNNGGITGAVTDAANSVANTVKNTLGVAEHETKKAGHASSQEANEQKFKHDDTLAGKVSGGAGAIGDKFNKEKEGALSEKDQQKNKHDL